MSAERRLRWQGEAVDFIRGFVRTAKAPFSANDLWAAGLSEPADARWINHALLRAERLGLIRRTGHKVRSVRGVNFICLWEVTA